MSSVKRKLEAAIEGGLTVTTISKGAQISRQTIYNILRSSTSGHQTTTLERLESFIEKHGATSNSKGQGEKK